MALRTEIAIAARVRREKSYEMYVRGMTTKEISEAYNVNVKTVRRWLAEYRRDVSEQTAGDAKIEDLATLTLLKEKWEPLALSGGQEELEQLLKILDRRAKYLGLYAPARFDATVEHSGAIQHISRDDMRREVMERLRKFEQQNSRLSAMDAKPSDN